MPPPDHGGRSEKVPRQTAPSSPARCRRPRAGPRPLHCQKFARPSDRSAEARFEAVAVLRRSCRHREYSLIKFIADLIRIVNHLPTTVSSFSTSFQTSGEPLSWNERFGVFEQKGCGVK